MSRAPGSRKSAAGDPTSESSIDIQEPRVKDPKLARGLQSAASHDFRNVMAGKRDGDKEISMASITKDIALTFARRKLQHRAEMKGYL